MLKCLKGCQSMSKHVKACQNFKLNRESQVSDPHTDARQVQVLSCTFAAINKYTFLGAKAQLNTYTCAVSVS